MRMAVLSVAYPFAPVGPDAVGGAEQVLAALDSALVATGQESIVAACHGSRVRGELIQVGTAEALLTEQRRRIEREQFAAALRRVLCTRRVDLVHMHGLDFCDYLPPPGPPVLVTLHLPATWYPAQTFELSRPRTYLCCVSRAQQQACPAGAAIAATIENGVPLDALRPGARKRNFALALGRVCAEKGFHLALAAAHAADVPLILAGSVFPYVEHQNYFAHQIAPRLSRSRRFVGAVTLTQKRRLLAAARCLLVPSLAPETSSLVAMESLACGTPVIAFRTGALPDIVEHGCTGILVDDEHQMARAIREIGDIDPHACRAAAEARFDVARMSAEYLRLFCEIVKQPYCSAECVTEAEVVCPWG